MTRATHFEIRPVNRADHSAVLALSARLTIGAAPWRDPDRVAAAARGWITLDTGAANTRAQRLYARTGFVPEDIRLSKPVRSGSS